MSSYGLSASPNPYRPYVVPLDPAPSVSSAGYKSSAASARDLLSDLDLPTEYLENPELGDLLSNLATRGLTKYVSVFLRQPFEIVKTTMQIQFLPRLPPQPQFPTRRHRTPAESDEEEDDEVTESEDELPLFSGGDGAALLDTPRGRSRKRGGQGGTYSPVPDVQPWELPRDSTSVRSILSALWTKDGAFGIWKGTNSTFMYSVLFESIQTWLSSLLAATFALPDPTLFDILDSPTPGQSLAAALSATAITALILAPIDIYRITRMILPSNTSRTSIPRTNPIPLIIPKPLILPTILHATIPAYLSSLFTLTFRPYFPRVTFSPAHYSLPFLASFIDLGTKLPLETVLRRAQVGYTRPEQSVVRVGRYEGVLSTVWDLVVEERGGVFRGWRIGFWGLMLAWVLKTTDALGRGQLDVEF